VCVGGGGRGGRSRCDDLVVRDLVFVAGDLSRFAIDSQNFCDVDAAGWGGRSIERRRAKGRAIGCIGHLWQPSGTSPPSPPPPQYL
jgi:hypothetical protein